MDLKKLATKPQLIKVVLDDDDIITEYDEPLEFYINDKQPIEQFVKFASATQDSENYGQMLEFCTDLILDKDGQPVMTDGLVLPNSVLMKCVNKVVIQMGK
jgi:hypothetical protein